MRQRGRFEGAGGDLWGLRERAPPEGADGEEEGRTPGPGVPAMGIVKRAFVFIS